MLKGELGVISTQDFLKGAIVFDVHGPTVQERTIYTILSGPNEHIDPRDGDTLGVGHFLNHSCEPNVGVQVIIEKDESTHIDIVARRDIEE